MKFLIEFSESNLQKFRNFIKLCNKTFTKSGIIMTIEKNKFIRVAPDPFSISDKFERDYFETKIMELYKNFTFIQYDLNPLSQSKKNSTYNKLELKISNRNFNNINQNEDSLNENIITFRIALEELNKLNEMLQTNFLFSNQLTIKAAAKPDFMNNEESKNYSNTYLSIFDKPTNSIKSGILFKPLKYFFKIIDYEDEDYAELRDSNNKISNLGNHLFCSIIKSKFFKKFCTMASKNFNKIMEIYTFKQRDIKEKVDKNHLIISYLNNSFSIGYFLSNNLIPHNNIINLEEFKKIYKIKINSEILLKLLKNFNFENDNPDLISIWTKGLVMKTEFILDNSFEDIENNNIHNNNNYIENNDGEDNYLEEEDSENIKSYMFIKSLIYYINAIEIIDYDENDDEKHISKKKYVLDLIDNNIDDMHEELNKSFDYNIEDDINDIKEKKDIIRGGSQFLDDEDEIEKENNEEKNDISNDEEKTEEDKKKKNKIKEKKKKRNLNKSKKNNKKKNK